MTLEVCAGSIESVLAAKEGGAQRVELCSALSEGGVTPSVGLMREARKVEGIKVHVLIRPRGGDFLYTEEEVRIMEEDIRVAREVGVDGVVIGALTKDGDIDIPTCKRLIEAATIQSPSSREDKGEGRNMSITFHRAFDMARDMYKSLEDVISLGCDRILTSGFMPNAEDGMLNLKNLVTRAQGRIIIMPGAGVNPQNASKILGFIGSNEIHASARSSRKSCMEYRNPVVAMGAKDVDEYARKETDAAIVAAILSAK